MAVAVIAIAIWGLIGSPLRSMADAIWPSNPAPWERVDAFFYPDKTNLWVHKMERGLGSVEECRRWVRQKAAANQDPDLTRSDFECGIGWIRDGAAGLKIYRATVR